MPRRAWRSGFVGRSAELAELEVGLAGATSGQGRLVFVAGDSGVGKTRLLAEFAARAGSHGVRVLSGDCVAVGEGELPYAPLVAVLRSLVRVRDPVLGRLPEYVRVELATLLPELADGAPAAARPADASAQGRMFEALLWLLDRLGDDAPVVLAIEDLHWADRATRAFFAFLGRNLGSERVLVVATYRADELDRRHPLRPLLADLERMNCSARVELSPLTREELAVQLGELLGAPPDEELVDRVLARSEGYPLFVEELIAASADARSSLPATLRDALMLRVERLSATAQAVMRVLAVGQRLDDEVLAEVTGLESAALQGALREGVASHILAIADEGGYRFRHALLREVVGDDLLPGERQAIALQLARALEARAEREGMSAYLAAAIATHFADAGDLRAALCAAVRAADAAERVHAYGHAAALLEHAVEMFDRVPEAEALAGADRAEILWRAAEDHKLEGGFVRQEALGRAALALVDERAEPHRAARFLGTLHNAQWHLGRGEESLLTLERALSLLPPGSVSRERGALLRSWASTMMLRGRNAEAVEAARETLKVADALGDTSLRGRALNALGTALMNLGDVDEGASTLREALALAERAGLHWEQNVAYINLGDALQLAGRLAEARAVVEEGIARELRPNRVWLVVLHGELAMEAGEWDRAEAILSSIRDRQIGNSLVNLDLRRAELALARGQHELASELLEEAARMATGIDEPQLTGVLGALRAELERRRGDLDAARGAVRDALASLEMSTDDAPRQARVSAAGTTVEADAAQHARDIGDPEGERVAIELAELHVARVRALVDDGRPLETAWWLVASAERTRAGDASDPRAFAAAADAWTALERPYPAAVMRFREAEAYVAVGDRAAAATAAREAHATAVKLGAGWLGPEIDKLAARARLGLAAGDGAAQAEDHVAPVQDPFGLTPRERQVLELLSRGATNREIGAQLFMAEKTASVHVSRILSKLNVRSRTEAAGVAHRTGLAT